MVDDAVAQLEYEGSRYKGGYRCTERGDQI